MTQETEQATECPWPIPASWTWATMGDIADVVGGGTPPTSDPSNYGGGVPWVTPADLSGYSAQTITGGARTLTKKGLDNSGARLMPAGTVLFSSRAPIGYVAIAARQVSTNQGFKSFILKSGSVRPEYVYYYLQRARELAIARASGTTFLEISGAKAKTIPIPVPSTTEQDRIVAEIERQFARLDAGVAALRRLQAHLRRYRAAILVAATTGRLVPTEAELANRAGKPYEPAPSYLQRILASRKRASTQKSYREPVRPAPVQLARLPEGWTWTTVDSVGDVLLGRRRAPEYLSSPHARPYLRVANVKDDRLDLSDVETMNWDDGDVEKYALRAGDILVSEGQSPERLGQSAIYPGGIEGLCFQATLHRFRPLPGGPSSRYAQLVFRAHVRTGLFRRLGSITTNIGHLTLEKFKAAPFPLPPKSEETRIVAETERLLSVADSVEHIIATQLARSQKLRASILRAAFEGRLVGPEQPARAPAA